MIGFGVEDFRNGVAKTGLSRANKYVLKITLPVGLTGAVDSTDIQEVFLRIDSVELPGKSLATSEVKYYGPPRKSPYGMTYEDLNCTLMLSANMRERFIFSAWMNYIYNYDTARLSYFKDYTTDLTFEVYGDDGSMLYSVKFEECYPLSIGAINFSYANEDVARLPLTFAYRKWTEISLKQLSGKVSPYADLPAAKSYPSVGAFNQSFSNMLNRATSGSPLGQIAAGFASIGGIDAKIDSVFNNFNNVLSGSGLGNAFGQINDFSSKLNQGIGNFQSQINGFQSQVGNFQNRLNQFNPTNISNTLKSKTNNFLSKKIGGFLKF